jgi:hypothetical protein
LLRENCLKSTQNGISTVTYGAYYEQEMVLLPARAKIENFLNPYTSR